MAGSILARGINPFMGGVDPNNQQGPTNGGYTGKGFGQSSIGGMLGSNIGGMAGSFVGGPIGGAIGSFGGGRAAGQGFGRSAGSAFGGLMGTPFGPMGSLIGAGIGSFFGGRNDAINAEMNSERDREAARANAMGAGGYGLSPDGGGLGKGGDPSGPSGGPGGEGMGNGGNAWAQGGPVTMERLAGPNPPGPDDGYGALEAGEHVIRKAAAQRLGPDLLAKLNSGDFKRQAIAKALRG